MRLALGFGQRLNLDGRKRRGKRVFLFGLLGLQGLASLGQLFFGSSNVAFYGSNLCVCACHFSGHRTFQFKGSGQLLLCLLDFFLVLAAALLCGRCVFQRHACVKQSLCVLVQCFFFSLQLQLKVQVSVQKRQQCFIRSCFTACGDLLFDGGDDFATCFTQSRERALAYGLLNCRCICCLGFGCLLSSLNSGCVHALKRGKVVGNFLTDVFHGLCSEVKLLTRLHIVSLQFCQLSIKAFVDFLQVGFSGSKQILGNVGVSPALSLQGFFAFFKRSQLLGDVLDFFAEQLNAGVGAAGCVFANAHGLAHDLERVTGQVLLELSSSCKGR